MSDHRPGRALRTTGGLHLRSYAIWILWGATAGFGLQRLHLERWLILAIVLAVPLGLSALVRSRLRGYDADTKSAHLAMKSGNPETAYRQFATVGERYRWPRVIARINDYNAAVALLRQGRHPEAIELLARVDAAGGVIKIDGALANMLAYAHALSGDVELAEAWQAEAQRRFARYSSTPPFPDLLSEVAVALRRGDAARVRRRLEQDWPQIEASLTGEQMRPLRVFRAFATAVSSDGRDAGVVTPLIAALGPVRRDELDYLSVQWPELAQFVASSIIASAA